jgi:hypothetical protein
MERIAFNEFRNDDAISGATQSQIIGENMLDSFIEEKIECN